jgi:Mrp family chromosome partitioning ATPase/capsular polysaccharide biosynthesis protein
MNTVTDRDDKGHRFARFLATLRERWWVVLFTLIVVGGLAFAVSLLLEPRYSATAQLAYSARDAQSASQALSDAGTAGLPHNISSDALTLQTSAFADRVSLAMGGAVSPEDLRSSTKASSDPQVDVIYVKTTAPDPNLVADIANAFADEFVKARQEELQGLLQAALEFAEGRIDSLTPEEKKSEHGLELEQQRDTLAMLLSNEITDYKVLERAATPTSAYFPRPFLNLLWGLCAGLVLGLALALLLGSLDRRIKDRSTLERVMDLPVLGVMPMTSRKKGGRASGGSSAVGFRKGHEALLESMRMLRSNLKVLGFGDTRRSVLITSTAPGEGKSTLAVNLALSMALSGDRVILVDADLRNPTIDRYLDIPNVEGLADALMDKSVAWSERIQAVDLAPFVDPRIASARRTADDETAVSKFLCLTSGTLPGNPTEVLESPAMTGLLAELQGISDYVILDGPPMLLASDSLVLAQSVDAVILASTLGKETAAEANQVRQLLARAEITALGLVICGARPQSREGYYYRPGHDRGTTTRRS